MFSKEAVKLTKSLVEAIKKIAEKREGGKKWRWEPETGELFALPDYEYNPHHLGIYLYSSDNFTYYYFLPRKEIITTQNGYFEYCVPFLHWERIERILEEMGYYLSVVGFEKDSDEWETEDYQAYICVKNKKDKQYKEWYGHNKSRQIAVMQAVIEAAKEIQIGETKRS